MSIHNTGLSIFILLFALPAFSAGPKDVPLSPADAKKEVRGLYEQIRKADSALGSSPFEKWQKDTAGLIAIGCMGRLIPKEGIAGKDDRMKLMKDAGISEKDARAFLNRPLLGTGSYALPDETELNKICPMLASEGVKPYCIAGIPSTEPPPQRKHRYMGEYVVLTAGRAQILHLTLKCSITHKKVPMGKTPNSGYGIDAEIQQNYSVAAEDIETLRGDGFGTWKVKNGAVEVAPPKLPAGYRSPSTLNLMDGPVHDVYIGGINLKMKNLKDPSVILAWSLVVEP